jgi:hypothetical protein
MISVYLSIQPMRLQRGAFAGRLCTKYELTGGRQLGSNVGIAWNHIRLIRRGSIDLQKLSWGSLGRADTDPRLHSASSHAWRVHTTLGQSRVVPNKADAYVPRRYRRSIYAWNGDKQGLNLSARDGAIPLLCTYVIFRVRIPNYAVDDVGRPTVWI